MERTPPSPTQRQRRQPRRGRSLHRLIPVLILAAAAILIGKREWPAFDDWTESLVAPERAAALKACRQRALETSASPAYARVLARGDAVSTQDGFYIKGVVIGEMGDDGTEVRIALSCYADADGRLISATRAPVPRD